jgi:hypothetical protein
MFYGLYDSIFVYTHSDDDNMIGLIHHTDIQQVIIQCTVNELSPHSRLLSLYLSSIVCRMTLLVRGRSDDRNPSPHGLGRRVVVYKNRRAYTISIPLHGQTASTL